MTARLRDALLSTRDLLLTVGPFLALGLALLALAYWALDPTPPRRMVLATGPAQGAYAEFAPRYVQALRRHGIQVELRSTEGSAENLRLLRAGEVDAAFVQAGNAPIDPPEEDEDDPMDGLASLGSLFLEPVWIFYREAAAQERLARPAVATLAELSGWRVNVGTVGSGVPRLVGRLLDANGLPRDAFELSHSAPTPAVVGLLAGELDALVFAQAPESPLVQMLLRTPGIGLLDLAQAEAYARRVPSVSPVRLPRGVVDLAQDLPPADVHLVAPTAMLLVREDTHPALQQLLVQAARAAHGAPGWFQRKGEFPTAAGSDVLLSPEAERFYRSGPPLLQRHLPFWLANLIDRMWVVLVSLVAVLIPLSRVLPPLYVFRIRSRIFRWYAQLRRIEDAAAAAQADRAALREELEAVDRKVQGLSVPLSHADELYSLRSHIAMVRRRLAD